MLFPLIAQLLERVKRPLADIWLSGMIKYNLGRPRLRDSRGYGLIYYGVELHEKFWILYCDLLLFI